MGDGVCGGEELRDVVCCWLFVVRWRCAKVGLIEILILKKKIPTSCRDFIF